MKRKINIAVIGVSQRGLPLIDLILEMKDVNILAVCDLYQDRAEEAGKHVVKAGRKTPLVTTDYRRALEVKGLDAVLSPSSWTSHVPIALDAMEHGLYAGIEVGGATSIQQCWDLVRTSERTGKPCMLMENCCYGQAEMTVLNLVKKGMFGECVHAEGGYRHDLREEVCCGREKRHYRLQNYLHRNGDVYPTHDLGPIAKYLDINRGNRMVTLSAMASKSVGLHHWLETHPEGSRKDLLARRFNLGDVVVTNIKCANGETITLFHDTSLPRPYSRANLLEGTKGIWSEDREAMYLEDFSKPGATWRGNWQPLQEIYDAFEHPLWKEFRSDGVKGGHGGMDYLVLRAFFEAVRDQKQTPIDVYDTAAWMAITPLSEDSCNAGGMPVAIPDFTDGKWIEREPEVRGKYCLSEVCEEFFPAKAQK